MDNVPKSDSSQMDFDHFVPQPTPEEIATREAQERIARENHNRWMQGICERSVLIRDFIQYHNTYIHIHEQELIRNDAGIQGGQGAFHLVKSFKFGWTGWKKITAIVEPMQDDAPSRKAVEQGIRELSLHCAITPHPHIVQFLGFSYDYFPQPYTEGVYPPAITGILMENVPGGSLFRYLLTSKELEIEIEEKQILKWSIQVADALEYLHSQEIIHRDANPKNILLSGDHSIAKLCDFGLAKEENGGLLIDNHQVHTVGAGTAIFSAPEVLNPDRNAAVVVDEIAYTRYTNKVDVYSFGLTLWMMYSKSVPFADERTNNDGQIADFQNFMLRLIDKDLRRPKPRPRPLFEQPWEPREEIRDIIVQCWDRNPRERQPDKRPTMTDVKRQLQTILETLDS